MIYIFSIFIIICLIGIDFKNKKVIDENALNRERTLALNGIFVGIVLFSHFNSYVTFTNKLDLLYYNLIYDKIGQLMVTTFLFFSGYGIFESIKNKNNYIDSFFRKRILKLFISFAIALIFYIIMNYFIEEKYSLNTILLSFTGWESIGNSNWFIYATFCLYINTLISFKLCKNKTNALLTNTILTLIYIIFTMKFKGYEWWYNTALCYPAGMWLSHSKDRIINILKNGKSYILISILVLILFILFYKQKNNYLVYEIYSILFVSIIILFNFKIKLGNPILLWLGKNTFNIYILQRMSFMILKYFKLNEYNIYLYFAISIIIIIIITILYSKITNKLFRIIKLK